MSQAASESDSESGSDGDRLGRIVTQGQIIRSIWHLIRIDPGIQSEPFIEESRIRLGEGGLSVKVVDQANISMVDLEVQSEAIEHYEADGATVALNLETFGDAIRTARVGRSGSSLGDLIELHWFEKRVEIEVRREFIRQSVRFLLDPNTIRGEPDVPTLELPWMANVDPEAFAEAVGAIGSDSVSIQLEADEDGENGDLLLVPPTDAEVGSDTFRFANAVDPANGGDGSGEESSRVSMAYLGKMAEAIAKSKMERLVIRFGDNFPVRLGFDHTEWGISGEYLLAPRLPNEEVDGDE